MSQTPTQRRREIDDARRRMVNNAIENLVRERPDIRTRTLANQIAGAIGLFGSDELELVEVMIDSIRIGGGSLQSVAAVVSRLLRGRATYGELKIDSDPRDWDLEHDEEICDAIVYEAIAALLRRRDRGLPSNAALLNTNHLDALSHVGAHVEHSTLAALVQRVQDAERPPTPFVILPAPWCLGSAMLFQHGAVRIADNTIVAVRCHHCGREWDLPSPELRRTGSGQYVIPTHEARR